MSQDGPKTAHSPNRAGVLRNAVRRAPERASIRTLALKALDGDHSEEPFVELNDSYTG